MIGARKISSYKDTHNIMSPEEKGPCFLTYISYIDGHTLIHKEAIRAFS